MVQRCSVLVRGCLFVSHAPLSPIRMGGEPGKTFLRWEQVSCWHSKAERLAGMIEDETFQS
jgi:hypothetical protein